MQKKHFFLISKDITVLQMSNNFLYMNKVFFMLTLFCFKHLAKQIQCNNINKIFDNYFCFAVRSVTYTNPIQQITNVLIL